MQNRRRAGIAVVAPMTLLLASGCAALYERTLDSWKGAPVQELVDSWGPPHEQFRDPRGSMVYQWSHRDIDGGSNASFQYKSGRQQVSPFCQTRFTVDENDIVRKWSYRGNDCSGTPRP